MNTSPIRASVFATLLLTAAGTSLMPLPARPPAAPCLPHFIREMSKIDSRQASRSPVRLSPSAKSAISAYCAALAQPEEGDDRLQPNGNVFARADSLNSLTHLCGGPDGLAPTLSELMRDKESETRRIAAAAVHFCDDPTFRHLYPQPQGAYHWFTLDQDNQWHFAFHRQIVPALAKCVDDPVTDVRLAALTSLNSLTYDSADAPWQTATPALARAAVSEDPAVRLAALKVLAYMPGDSSPATAALRSGLHGSQEEQSYALAAFCHAAQINRAAIVNAFLPDLASSDPKKRRQAATDIDLAAVPIWDGSFWHSSPPLENWWNDRRLFTTPSTFAISTFPELTSVQRDTELRERQSLAEAAQPVLLAALVKSASDPDHAVRSSAASSLEQIGKWTYATLGIGSIPNAAVAVRPQVENALAQAATSLQSTEPALAQRLRDLQAKVTTGPMVTN